MKFIIEQQAQFAADIQLLKGLVEANTSAIEANTSAIRQLVDVSMSLAHHAEEADRRLNDLGRDTDRRLNDLGKETDRRIRELVESGAHTDRRLDALIDSVDKLVRRNGS